MAAEPSVDEVTGEQLLPELVLATGRLRWPNLLGLVGLTPIVVALSWPTDREGLLVSWAVAIPVLAVMQVRLNVGAGRSSEPHEARRWVRRMMVVQFAIGVAIGLTPLLCGGAETDAVAAHNSAMVAVLCAVTAGAMVAFAGVPAVARSLIVPMWAVGSILVVSNGVLFVGIGGAIFGLIALGYNEIAHRVLRESISNRLAAARLTERLRRSEATARAVVDTAGEAIWSLDDRGVVVAANPAAVELVGGDHAGRPLSVLLPALSLDSGTGSHESTLVRVDGSERSVIVSIGEGVGSGYTVTATDVSALKLLEQRLEHDATHDALTGLPNRTGLLRRLEDLRRTDERCALLFVDLDGFKHINDTLGHAAGDAVLEAAAERIRRSVRGVDTVARLGGDEFVVVAAGVDLERARSAARRIVSGIEQPFTTMGKPARLSCSVGICIEDEIVDPDDALTRADIAMYEAKQRGRGQVSTYAESMRSDLDERVRMRDGLLAAVEEGRIDFVGQPLVALDSGRIVAIELLARWDEPGIGPVPPTVFIPLAEDLGVIDALGRLALDRAARLAVELGRPPDELQIGVNLSAGHVLSGATPEDVRAACARHGADPASLVVELTESAMADDLVLAARELSELRAMDTGVAIDDFGTGYSSLAYLHAIPASAIKLDSRIIGGLASEARCRTLVRALAKLAADLGMVIVAEGIEDEATAELLASYGVPFGQGWFFARPLPLSELPQRVSIPAWDRRATARTMTARP